VKGVSRRGFIAGTAGAAMAAGLATPAQARTRARTLANLPDPEDSGIATTSGLCFGAAFLAGLLLTPRVRVLHVAGVHVNIVHVGATAWTWLLWRF
jgi:hypothetical protein